MATEPPTAAIERRLHLCVGRNLFLPTRLRVLPPGGGGEALFGEPQLHECLTMLHAEVPARLAPLLQQRTPTRERVEGLRGETLTATITFQPTSSSLWLLGSADADGRTREAVPYTLLCDVELVAR